MSSAKTRLLIAEDNDALREMFASAFAALGFEPIVAESGGAALQLAAKHEIDAVLSDLDLPGMPGLELCRALSRQFIAQARPVPIWLMTGSYADDLTVEAVEAGACEVFRKPFTVGEVATTILRRLADSESRKPWTDRRISSGRRVPADR